MVPTWIRHDYHVVCQSILSLQLGPVRNLLYGFDGRCIKNTRIEMRIDVQCEIASSREETETPYHGAVEAMHMDSYSTSTSYAYSFEVKNPPFANTRKKICASTSTPVQ